MPTNASANAEGARWSRSLLVDLVLCIQIVKPDAFLLPAAIQPTLPTIHAGNCAVPIRDTAVTADRRLSMRKASGAFTIRVIGMPQDQAKRREMMQQSRSNTTSTCQGMQKKQFADKAGEDKPLPG